MTRIVVVAVAIAVVGAVTLGVALMVRPTAQAGTLVPVDPPSSTPSESSPTPSATAQTSLSTTVSGQTLLLELPDDAAATGLVVFFPDRGTDAAAELASEPAVALRSAGWAVAAVAGSGSEWGSPDSAADTQALLQWAAGYAPTAPLVVVADGSGAATSIGALGRSARVVPTCWISDSPQADLMAHGQADPAIEQEIVRAWGGVPDADQLPLALVSSLPTATSYRIVSPPADAPAIVADDVATLIGSLESSGHDVEVFEPDPSRSLLDLTEGCAA